MPGIRDALTDPQPTGGSAPMVPKLLESMPDDLRELAEKLLASNRSDGVVAEAFAFEGYKVSLNAIRNHRLRNRMQRFAK